MARSSELTKIKLSESDTLPRRLAFILDYMAKKHPKRFIPVPDLAKKLLNLRNTPREDSEDVARVRDRLSATRRILGAEFARGLVNARGIGVRASVDDTDRARNCARKTARRVASAIRGHKVELDAIDTRKISDTKTRAWITRQKSTLVSLEESKATLDLLPPGADPKS